MDFLADTSYKQSQAEVIGQLTAAPVATGSQLVGYSGFSTEAFVREPYSADLDFGTGEWSVSAWVNVPVTLPAMSTLPLLPTQLASNIGPAFTVTTGWGTHGSTPAETFDIVGGELHVIDSGATLFGGPAFNVVAGRSYKMVLTFRIVYGNIDVGRNIFSFNTLRSSTRYTGAGTYTLTENFTATATETQHVSFDSRFAGAAPCEFYVTSLSIQEYDNTRIAERAHSSGAIVSLGLTPAGFFTVTAYDGTTTRNIMSYSAYNTGTWLKVDTYYKTDGSLSIAVNGQQVATTGTQTPLLTLNNSNAVLTIGNNFSLNAPFPGSISLLKLSATVPTTEQLQWIYEQEKALFSANALCVLPDSNTVSDLTFDDKTNRLIAVSSANESYWSGLTRVYTEAVTSGGSLGKVVSTSNVHLVSRSTVNPGVDVTLPAYNIKAHLESDRTEATIKQVVVFDFDPIDNSQTAFVLPIGYSAVAVYKAGTELRETITTAKDWSRSFDGFKETITLTTAPGTTNWIQIHAVKE